MNNKYTLKPYHFKVLNPTYVKPPWRTRLVTDLSTLDCTGCAGGAAADWSSYRKKPGGQSVGVGADGSHPDGSHLDAVHTDGGRSPVQIPGFDP